MGGPGWLPGIFAALMLTVAVYCAGRLAAARRWRRPTELDTDAAHIVMGVAMAGMLVSGLRTLPAAAWAGVFAAGAAWFGGRMLPVRRGAAASPWRCLYAAPHLVECAAMLYMFLALPAARSASGAVKSMAGMSGSAAGPRFSFLSLAMALFLLGYVVVWGDRLTVRAPPPAVPPSPAVRPAGAGASSGASAGGSAEPRYLAPRCAALCKIAMGLTMGYMLVVML